MTELDRALVRRKLAAIARNLADLAPIEALTLPQYLEDRLRRKAVERLLQEVVEAGVDVNLHVLRTLGVPLPGDYYGVTATAVPMAEVKDIQLTSNFGESLARGARPRGRAVQNRGER